MNKPIQLLTIVLSLCLTIVISSNAESEKLSINNHLELARSQGKMTMVYFYANWCMPCEWMKENAFSNPEFDAFVSNYYVTVKMNIDEEIGKKEQEKYDVVMLPSILIFDPEGSLLAKYEEAMSATQLLTILRKHNQLPNINPITSNAPPIKRDYFPEEDLLDAPKPENLFVPALIPDEMGIPEPFGGPLISEEKVEKKLTSKHYYGVQVGAFSNYQNAQKQLTHYNSSHYNRIEIVSDHVNGNVVYKLISGKFGTEMAAEQHRTSLKRHGMNGFVKKIYN